MKCPFVKPKGRMQFLIQRLEGGEGWAGGQCLMGPVVLWEDEELLRWTV
jgi:hypothetical protein